MDMIQEDLKKMLNLTYELEGLLEMALKRGDNLPEALVALVADKSFVIAEIADKWKVDTHISYSSEISHTYEASDDADKEVEIFVSEVLPQMQKESESDELLPDIETQDDDQPGGLDTSDNESSAEAEPEGVETLTEDVVELSDELSDAAIFDDGSDEADIADEVADNPESEITKPYVNGLPERQDGGISHSGRPLASFFSINDKFRFRRELFSNSNAEMMDALNLIEAMESEEEAEDYFFNDLQWDKESEDVAAFIKIVHKYFSN